MNQTAEKLFDTLTALRSAQADAPEDERRELFRRTIAEQLQGVEPARADTVVAEVRQRLVDEARDRDRRLAELEAQVAELRNERDRLQQENAALRDGTGAPAAPPAPAPSGSDAGLDRVRQGLMQIAAGKKATSESIGLSGADGRMFRLVQELLRFAQDYEMGLNFLLAEFRIGPSKDMDTQMMRSMKQLVRKRFRDCLEDKDGSIQALKDTLSRNARFLVDLNKAYNSAIADGSRQLLAQLDPQPILDEHKQMIGHNFEKAWHKLAQKQADLSNLSKGELSERFYFEPFRSKLADHIGS